MTRPMYFDYAATTPVDPEVIAAMVDCLQDSELFGNPASQLHAYGRAASRVVEGARAQVADLIGARADEIVWTSGATEADNLAVIGTARFRSLAGRRIVTSATEHPAVLDACRYLEQSGFQVVRLQPDSRGIISLQQVADALTPDTTLVSIMHVNNEIGVVQDIAAIGQLCRANGSLFHVDAAQSAAWLPINVQDMCVDLMSLSAQKMYGPKGVGVLYLNRDRARRIEPLMFGGGQERGLRPGTIPTHQVVGMGKAAALVSARRSAEEKPLQAQRDRLRGHLLAVPGVLLNGNAAHCASHIINVSVTGVEGESLHYALGELAVSAGSACTTLSSEPSTVLRCLGRSEQLARASVRFSLGRQTTDREIDRAGEIFAAAVQHLRQVAPKVTEALA